MWCRQEHLSGQRGAQLQAEAGSGSMARLTLLTLLLSLAGALVSALMDLGKHFASLGEGERGEQDLPACPHAPSMGQSSPQPMLGLGDSSLWGVFLSPTS